ncbi:MAG: dependent oxidoreductase [Bacteroidota bacterium]|nr:dependent oxidoreductase [Bacteroidota bacterium]
MLSFWEKQSLIQYDIIIVGSGIVGLSTALSIKEKAPQYRVLVLERNLLPTGASTKNAGFACIGSLTEILDDLNNMSEEEVLQLVKMRLKGLRKLRTRLGDENIDYAENGSWELIRNTREDMFAAGEMDTVNAKLQPVLGAKAFELYDYKERQTEFGFSMSHLQYIVKNCFEGELNTGKMMRCLIDLCMSKGIEIKTGCEVVRIEENKNGVNVVANDSGNEMVFNAQQVGVCTNAFTRQFYPDLDIQPGRGQVLITKPIIGLKFKGIYHFDKGYYYFRRLGDRILFGGGRNLDFETERTTDFSFNQKIQNDLLDKLRTIIVPGLNPEVEDWWTGIMAFGSSKFPILMRQSERICMGVRMGGMGVAIGSGVGEKLANLIIG